MKSSAWDRSNADAPSAPATKRRSLLLGAGVAGAAAVAVKTLPVTPAEAEPLSGQKAVDDTAGYRLSQHVLRYYETTKV